LVAAGRRAARDRAADFFAVARLARMRAFFFVFAAARRRDDAAARVPVVEVAPAATRVECFGRWRMVLFGAASASDVALNAISNAATSSFR
jgi:hypothetical protein